VKIARRAFIVGITLAASARADDDTDSLLADIAKARKPIKSLRADLTQERKLTLLATSVKSTGRLYFVTPDRLRWELAPPDDVVYWIGPEGLSFRTRSSGATVPASGAKIGRALVDLRALVAGDLAQLRTRYTLAAARAGDEVRVTGTTKDPANTSVRGFTLVLDKTLVVPLRATLLEGKTDTIEIAFTNAAVNAAIDPALMRP
jgi:outer membrane lipoprotein-sorting protein